MAPVMSSDTVARTVRSPSARSPISFISRKMAPWVASFSASAMRRCCSDSPLRRTPSSLKALTISTSISSAMEPKIAAEKDEKSCSAISFS
jgi:hypothetical protein